MSKYKNKTSVGWKQYANGVWYPQYSPKRRSSKSVSAFSGGTSCGK